MEKVRGFVYFEERNIDEVRKDFKDFKIPGLRYTLFNGLTRLKKRIEMPGVLIDGEADLKGKKDCSKELVEILRNRVGLIGDCKNCDVSSAISNEDYIIHIKKGNLLGGKYVAVRILPPYPGTKELEQIALNLGELVDAQDVAVRGVEPILYKNKEIDKRCIDLIGQIEFDTKKNNIEDYLESNKVILEGYTLIDLL